MKAAEPNKGLLPSLTFDEDEEAAAFRKRRERRNDIKDIRGIKMLDKVDLDFESPRLRKALDNLGVSLEECQKK